MSNKRTERKLKERRLLEQVGSEPKGNGFARALASTDFHTRERGLQALTVWLSRRSDIQEADLLRLWKALFFCFWHSDKQPVQAALAERLSEIMTQIPDNVGDLYFRTFVRTMRREWFSIDRLRLDKFMMLARKFYTQHLRQLAAADWDVAAVAAYAEFWLKEVLLPTDTLVAAGVAYHLTELVLPQLTAVVQEGCPPPPRPALHALLGPYCAALAATGDQVLVRRLRQGLLDPLQAEVQAPSEAAPLRHLDAAALAEQLFQLGASKETRTLNREVLYEASKALEKASKQRTQEAPPPVAAAKGARKDKTSKKRAGGDESAAKPKKRKASEGVVLAGASQQANGHATAVQEPAPPPAAAHAGPPLPASLPAKKKKKSKAATPATQPPAKRHVSTDSSSVKQQAPPAGEVTPLGSPSATARKKSVRFSLKRNLVMTIGDPPAPQDVRTPPTSKPKGSALKVSRFAGPGTAPARLQSRLNGQMRGAAPAAGGTAAGPERGNGVGRSRQRSLPSPHSVPRPRASQFF